MGQNRELGVELCRLGERMDGGSAGQGLVVVALFPRELLPHPPTLIHVTRIAIRVE